MKISDTIDTEIEAAAAGVPAARRRIWPFFMLCLFLVYLLLIGWGLGTLWDALSDYQRCLPLSVAQATLDRVKAGDYEPLNGADGFVLSRYENDEIKAAYLAELFAPVDGLAVQKKAAAEGQMLFYCTAGGKRVADITLKDSGWASPYGRTLYVVQSVSGVYSKLQPTYTITSPGEIDLLINGRPLDKKARVGVPVAYFADMPGQGQPPELLEYRITGLLSKPIITVAEGQPGCELVTDESGTNVQLVRDISDARRDEVTRLATTVGQLQARYMSRDAGIADLRPYLLLDGPAERTLRSLDTSWYIDHEKYAFEGLSVENIVEYDPNRISCEVSFDYIITHGKKIHHFPTTYTLYFTRAAETERFLLGRLTVR